MRGRNGDRPDPEDGVGHNRVVRFLNKGVVTSWYFAVRCEEECYRAERDDRSLSLLLIEPVPAAGALAVARQIGAWLQSGLRSADLATYLSRGRYAVLLPETGCQAASLLAMRCRRAVGNVYTGIASFPEDGQSLAELIHAACGQANEPVRRAV